MTLTAETPALTSQQIDRLKKMLLKKGAEINQKLVELLNNPKVKMEEIVIGKKPGEKPVDRMRRFMALIEKSLKAVREGTYGRCEQCAAPIPYEHLEQVPWIDTCQKCAAPPEENK